MKNVSNINWSRAIRTATFSFLFLFLLASIQVQAADTTKSVPVEIKYIGSIDSKPVFQISFDNEIGAPYYLTLRDEDGNLIYEELIKDKKYVRKIELEDVDLNEMKIRLTLSSKKTTQTQVFEINKSTCIIENVEIAKL